MRLLNTDFDTIKYPEKISIYGCGAIGRIFSQKIKDRCEIIEFIDRLPRQEYYDGIPVVTIQSSKADENTTIIIVPSQEYDLIEKKLLQGLKIIPKIMSIEQFLAKGRIIDPNF